MTMSGKVILGEKDRANLTWITARASTAYGECVQIASSDGRIAVRDSKDPAGPILIYSSAVFRVFINGARKGEFDSLVH